MKKSRKMIIGTLVAGLVLQLAACGTILHPERKGQISGQLDPGIVVLDALGLLFFFVPGVIAFAVDFSNGTIYLPGGSASTANGEVNIVRLEGELTDETIERAVLEHTGEAIRLEARGVEAVNKVTTPGALASDVRFL